VFRQIGPPELIIILLIIVLLFGAKKLPETARGLGRSLRIFKAETKGLGDDEADSTAEASSQPAPAAPKEITGQTSAPPPPTTETPAAQPAPSSADERS
jgi:sec-independent protein translocase protein TatA